MRTTGTTCLVQQMMRIGVYGIPYLTQEEVSYQPADFDAASALFRQHISVMADYVHDLYELNPDSRFNLYCVDFYCGMVNSVIYANKIPSSQYSLTVMSDGAFTYNRFASVYDSSNPASQHENLIAQWAAMKEATYSTGVADSSTMNWNNSNKYLWAIVDSEPNAQLWVARKDLIKTPDDDNAFGLQIQSNPKVVQANIGNLLKQNIQPSESNTAEFKALYNFNDSYFADAEEQGKKVMLFLGTRVTSETAFSDYARFAMSYFREMITCTTTKAIPERRPICILLSRSSCSNLALRMWTLRWQRNSFCSLIPKSIFRDTDQALMQASRMVWQRACSR